REKVPPAGPEITNLIPNDADHVLHVFLRDALAPESQPYNAVFKATGGVDEEQFRRVLGFSPAAIDRILRSEKYGSWTFNVLHATETFDLDALRKTLGLKDVPGKNANFFQVTGGNPWFDGLGRLAVGVPGSLRALNPTPQRPAFVLLLDPGTLIIADEGPLRE